MSRYADARREMRLPIVLRLPDSAPARRAIRHLHARTLTKVRPSRQWKDTQPQLDVPLLVRDRAQILV